MITLAFLLFFVKEGSGLFPDRQMPGLPRSGAASAFPARRVGGAKKHSFWGWTPLEMEFSGPDE